MRGRLPASIALIAAVGAVAVPTAGAQAPQFGTLEVNPSTGTDATCVVNPAVPQQACRTVARAVDLAARGPMNTTIRLSPGLHVVDTAVRFPAPGREVSIIGAGGAQSVVRMTGAGSIVMNASRSQVRSVVVTGDAPGVWLTGLNGTLMANLAVVRPRAAGSETVRLRFAQLADSVVTAVGAPVAIVAEGQSGVHQLTVSGGRLALDDMGANLWGLANQVVASRGIITWGGTPRIYNSALSSPPGINEPALLVAQRPAGLGRPSPSNAPIMALSSIVQNGCAGAVGIQPGTVPTGVLVAGSYVQWPACGASVSRLPNAGGGARTEITWQSSVLVAPDVPAALGAVGGSPPPTVANQSGVRAIGGIAPWIVAGGQWPTSLMPVAGSPLLDFATDAVSAEVGVNFPCSLTTPHANCRAEAQRLGVLRPTNGLNLANRAPDAGAYEWSRLVASPPAMPSADGIPVVPVGDGPAAEPVPAIGGIEGAANVPGAPQAGVPTGQQAAAGVSRPTARVSVVAPRITRLGRALRVRVRVWQPARVKLVLRRALARPTARTATRVVGAKAVRLRRAGWATVVIPLNSGARRGQMTVGATARQPGYEPGHDLAITRVR